MPDPGRSSSGAPYVSIYPKPEALLSMLPTLPHPNTPAMHTHESLGEGENLTMIGANRNRREHKIMSTWLPKSTLTPQTCDTNEYGAHQIPPHASNLRHNEASWHGARKKGKQKICPQGAGVKPDTKVIALSPQEGRSEKHTGTKAPNTTQERGTQRRNPAIKLQQKTLTKLGGLFAVLLFSQPFCH